MTENNNKWLVVVNPKASIGKAEKDWPEIKQILINEGIAFDFVVTEYQRHAIELVRDNITEKGYTKVISIGGDGTNNEVINGIFTQKRFPTEQITMGIIPMGTGNDWRRTFGFNIDYQENVNIIKAGCLFKHDIGKVTYFNHGDPQVRYFLNAAGTGLDEFVCKTTNMMKSQGKGGTSRYMLNVAKCLLKYDCIHLQLIVDDQLVFDDEILSLSVGNCRYNGGGMMMMPDAIPNDGLFDITAIRKVGIPKFAANITKIYDGTFINKLKEVSTYRGQKIKIVSIPEHRLILETEGENLTNSPFDFEMLSQAIYMVIPPSFKL
jgi:YegS/Rv2252/BmrU family lipid kinase